MTLHWDGERHWSPHLRLLKESQGAEMSFLETDPVGPHSFWVTTPEMVQNKPLSKVMDSATNQHPLERNFRNLEKLLEISQQIILCSICAEAIIMPAELLDDRTMGVLCWFVLLVAVFQ